MKRDPRKVVILVSVAMSAVMLAGKLTAYGLTGSVAILSDAAESVVHGAATVLAAFSLWYSLQPADREHTYGHGRIAYFSAGFEGALVFAASLAVLYNGVVGLIYPTAMRNIGWGIGIAGALALINLFLGLMLLRIGRTHNSLILTANGHHILSDMWTTLAAIIGIVLVLLTGIWWLDPVAALVIGLVIMSRGASLLAHSYQGLMDRADKPLTDQLLQTLEAETRNGTIVGFHQLRCRRTDDIIWVELHVQLPGDMPMHTAHEHLTHLEEVLKAPFPRNRMHVMTHPEPDDHDAAHPVGYTEPPDPLA
jgi:cation diffusion facilitator family transporter